MTLPVYFKIIFIVHSNEMVQEIKQSHCVKIRVLEFNILHFMAGNSQF